MRATVEDYPEEHLGVPGNPTEDTESFVDLLSRSDSPIPIVQRESSLTRLQHAFADHGTYDPTSQAASTVRGPATPRYIPREMDGPVEMGMHNPRHDPVMVNNIPDQGIEPDVLHAPQYDRNRERTPAPYAHVERARTPHVDRNPSSRNHGYERPARSRREMDVYPMVRSFMEPAYCLTAADVMIYKKPTPMRDDEWHGSSQDEYPPVVVVVEHGRNGKDTYYVIPGGAPVIFEDEDGNELTRYAIQYSLAVRIPICMAK